MCIRDREKVVIPESVQKIEKSALNKVQHVVFHGNPASHVAIAFIREKPATEYMPDTASYTIRIDLPGNKTVYMPRYVKFDDIYTISDIISKPNLAIADILTLHAYASSTISKPVSYTHLDVYKRQIYINEISQNNLFIIFNI